MLKNLGIFLLFFCLQSRLQGQVCPPNIGFEDGTFTNWECSVGSISQSVGEITVTPSNAQNNRHTMIANSYPQMLDFYGGFPVNCPNGSGYSIQLGNNSTGRQAERVSYTFTVPNDQDNYSIIYNYAVVFQNPPHAEWEQPKFTANVFDVTNNTYITCSSFSYAASSNLPGFKESTVKDSVFYKTWTPVSIKLSGYAGRTIRLEFTTNDCTRGGHFGYAYVDVNQNCTSPISGNTYCNNAQSLTLTAPFGFAGYRWFPLDFSKVIGSSNTMTFSPVPAPNENFAVEVTPYPDQGCMDTIYTTIKFLPVPFDLKVKPNLIACSSTGVDLTAPTVTAGSTPGLSFAYYTDISQTDYVPTPKQVSQNGTFFIKATNAPGCTDFKQVTATIEPLPAFTVTDPQPVFRPTTINLSKTIAPANQRSYEYSFWKDDKGLVMQPIPDAISKTGTYFIRGNSLKLGNCATTQPVNVVIKDPVIIPPNIFTPNGDGINDTWVIPQLAFYPECFVQIFTRSGRLIFTSFGYNIPWDGKYEGKDVPVATYYWVIKASSELPHIGGGVTVVR
jgi:gliding motility-associated-like protein